MNSIIANAGSIFIASISMSIPLILAAIGGTFSVRGGIMALGLESMMMTGAFTAVLGSYFSGSAAVGVICGISGGCLLGLLHGILCIRYKVDQVISGIGLNLLVSAAATLLMQLIWGNRGSSPSVKAIGGGLPKLLGRIPVVGGVLSQLSVLAYVAIILAVIGWIIMFYTRYGLRLRVVGEDPKAADSLGLRVHALKYSGVIICGGLAGLSGTYLSLGHMNMYVRDMTAGRGYIAVVIAILARYNPLNVVICALLFGFFDALQIYMQGQLIPTQIIQMLPYIVTLLVLAFCVKHIQPPAGVGKYEDE